ncbi:MAG: MoaD/ThiS family protein [Candidatus Promineifilaceae bacterium]
MTTIRIPTPLRPYAGGQSRVQVEGATVAEALDYLTRQYPDLQVHLFDGETLRSFVNVFLNQEDVRNLNGPETAVTDDDTLLIIPSIAGG